MKAIHGLVPPTKNAKHPTEKEKTWKYSIKDSQDNTFFICSSVTNFDERLKTLIAKNKEYKIPTNVLIGCIENDENPRQYIVIFDEIRYSFETVLEALECAVAIHFVFSIKYQSQSINFWKFIQGFFYSMPLEAPTNSHTKDMVKKYKRILQL